MIKLNYYSQIQIHRHTKSKLKMHIKIFEVMRINSIIVNIQNSLRISISQTKKLLESSKIKYQEFQLISS